MPTRRRTAKKGGVSSPRSRQEKESRGVEEGGAATGTKSGRKGSVDQIKNNHDNKRLGGPVGTRREVKEESKTTSQWDRRRGETKETGGSSLNRKKKKKGGKLEEREPRKVRLTCGWGRIYRTKKKSLCPKITGRKRDQLLSNGGRTIKGGKQTNYYKKNSRRKKGDRPKHY